MSLLSRLAVQAARAYGILSSNPNNVSADYLVVAGGAGGGGATTNQGGGGGGAGGLRTSTTTLSTLNTYSITVGAGGTGGTYGGSAATNGVNSVISGTGLTTITSTGGGAGGVGPDANGSNGGSGGGGGSGGTLRTGGTGTSGQGNNGGQNNGSANYAAGGGGGAGAAGGDGGSVGNGNGGNGSASSISGSSVTYAGGGGAGKHVSASAAGTGGTGGGGNGGSSSAGTAGTVNLGGGGGGGSSNNVGGAGGSGIVIISYTSATPKFVGGTITTSGGKQIHTFTSSGTLSPITPITASYLVVAGGGGGGSSGGGGGAGGLLTSSTTLYSGATYIVTVGAGGNGGAANATTGTASSGSSSSLSGTGLTTLTATGGGGGGNYSVSGATGGSGGGAGRDSGSGGAGTSGQGFAGGATGVTGASGGAGGGGGSSAVGSAGVTNGTGNGGAGTSSSISGTSTTYAGGGGGGGYNSGTNGTGGSGGGGTGGTNAAQSGVNGTPNTGGGGGGAGGPGGGSVAGAAGGSGIVIISYAGSQAFNGGLVTSSGGNTIHTFTSTGALTPLTNNLNNSLRFRSSANAYLSRTATTPTNNKVWTWSAWIKRGKISSESEIFSGGTTSTALSTIYWSSADKLSYTVYGIGSIASSAVFRDPSAWYHVVVAVDTTQAVDTNRIKLYINGNQQTYTGTVPHSQNSASGINSAAIQLIGATADGYTPYSDQYLADINFIDGQALEPYYFGNNDANGVWKPIQYKGTYGTNGFYLTFGNTTSTTTLGYDSSPNGNNWTCNNISLTAGTTYDAMLDVPTNTSATVANYAVLNPLDTGSNITLSAANLQTSQGAAAGISKGTIGISSGKWYWEVTLLSGTTAVGIADVSSSRTQNYVGQASTSYGYYSGNGNKYNNATGTSYGASYTTNDVIGVALDMDAGTLTFYKNNTSQGTAYSSLSGTFTPAIGNDQSNTTAFNAGQRPFSYTPPTGFVALNTYNLPTPTILQGNKYMDATLYTGTGTTQNIVNAAGFKPDLVWTKVRNQAYGHALFDSVRGVGNALQSNNTNAEDAWGSSTLASFNSNGFTAGADTSYLVVNSSGNTFVGWQWQAGQGSTSSNTSGSITSTVSVNTTAGFSVVTYTGTGANATVGHGLGVAPKMIIAKCRGAASQWGVYHTSVDATPQNYALLLNSTAAKELNSLYWNNTAPTSTVFSLGGSSAANTSGQGQVAYCFAEIAGFSKFGSYTGNGSTDGPFVFTGFRPKFILAKRTDTAGFDWIMTDSSRSPSNVVDKRLFGNTNDAESSATTPYDYLSNGFKLRNTNANENASGATYIYMAFAEHPFKNANAR